MEFVVIAKWIAQEGQELTVGRALERLAARSREELGCLEYRVHCSVDDPRSYLLYERYASQDAYLLHGDSEHFRLHAIEEGIPLLESRSREFYASLDF